MPFTTLVDVASLAAALDRQNWVLVDCRFALDALHWGEREYERAHIPGAVYAHLERDLSGEKTGQNGRHPLPDPIRLADTFGRFGIGPDTQVVAYDQDTGAWASRCWWLLRWLGHEQVAVLDGGFAAWLAQGHATRGGRETRPRRDFLPLVRADLVVDVQVVDRLRSRSDWRLIDARAPERFRGDAETIDRAAGHIPGALNRFFRLNLTEGGVFQAPSELKRTWDTLLDGTAPERTVCYCGSGVTACHNLLALEHAGLTGAKLYPGSWSEWSSTEERPVETGEGRQPGT